MSVCFVLFGFHLKTSKAYFQPSLISRPNSGRRGTCCFCRNDTLVLFGEQSQYNPMTYKGFFFCCCCFFINSSSDRLLSLIQSYTQSLLFKEKSCTIAQYNSNSIIPVFSYFPPLFLQCTSSLTAFPQILILLCMCDEYYFYYLTKYLVFKSQVKNIILLCIFYWLMKTKRNLYNILQLPVQASHFCYKYKHRYFSDINIQTQIMALCWTGLEKR